MENNLQNKSMFFSIYYKQRVYPVFKLLVLLEPIFINEVNWDAFIVLKPLSQLSDQDAKAISEIEKDWSTEDPVVRGKALIRDFDYTSLEPLKVVQIVDYLRSKGYALHWMGLSVEKQIEYGWVKLKK